MTLGLGPILTLWRITVMVPKFTGAFPTVRTKLLVLDGCETAELNVVAGEKTVAELAEKKPAG